VFVIRIGSGSFRVVSESLVEFPQELRDPQSVAPGDSKNSTPKRNAACSMSP